MAPKMLKSRLLGAERASREDETREESASEEAAAAAGAARGGGEEMEDGEIDKCALASLAVFGHQIDCDTEEDERVDAREPVDRRGWVEGGVFPTDADCAGDPELAAAMAKAKKLFADGNIGESKYEPCVHDAVLHEKPAQSFKGPRPFTTSKFVGSGLEWGGMTWEEVEAGVELLYRNMYSSEFGPERAHVEDKRVEHVVKGFRFRAKNQPPDESKKPRMFHWEICVPPGLATPRSDDPTRLFRKPCDVDVLFTNLYRNGLTYKIRGWHGEADESKGVHPHKQIADVFDLLHDHRKARSDVSPNGPAAPATLAPARQRSETPPMPEGSMQEVPFELPAVVREGPAERLLMPHALRGKLQRLKHDSSGGAPEADRMLLAVTKAEQVWRRTAERFPGRLSVAWQAYATTLTDTLRPEDLRWLTDPEDAKRLQPAISLGAHSTSSGANYELAELLMCRHVKANAAYEGAAGEAIDGHVGWPDSLGRALNPDRLHMPSAFHQKICFLLTGGTKDLASPSAGSYMQLRTDSSVSGILKCATVSTGATTASQVTRRMRDDPHPYCLAVGAARGLAALEELEVARLGEAAVLPEPATNDGAVVGGALPYARVLRWLEQNDPCPGLPSCLAAQMRLDYSRWAAQPHQPAQVRAEAELAGAFEKQLSSPSKSFLLYPDNFGASTVTCQLPNNSQFQTHFDLLGIGAQVHTSQSHWSSMACLGTRLAGGFGPVVGTFHSHETYMLVAPGALGRNLPMHMALLFDESQGDFFRPLFPLSPLVQQAARPDRSVRVSPGDEKKGHPLQHDMLSLMSGWEFDQSARMCRFAEPASTDPERSPPASALIWMARQGVVMVHEDPVELKRQFAQLAERIGLAGHVCDYMIFDWMCRPHIDRQHRNTCTAGRCGGSSAPPLLPAGSVRVGDQATRFAAHYAAHDHVDAADSSDQAAHTMFAVRTWGAFWLRVLDTVANSDVMSEHMKRARYMLPAAQALTDTRAALAPVECANSMESYLFLSRTSVPRKRGDTLKTPLLATTYRDCLVNAAYATCTLADLCDYVFCVSLESQNSGYMLKYNMMWTKDSRGLRFVRVRGWERLEPRGAINVTKNVPLASALGALHALCSNSGRAFDSLYMSLRCTSGASADCNSTTSPILFDKTFVVKKGADAAPEPGARAPQVSERGEGPHCARLASESVLRAMLANSVLIVDNMSKAHGNHPLLLEGAGIAAAGLPIVEHRKREMAGDVLEATLVSEASSWLVCQKIQALGQALDAKVRQQQQQQPQPAAPRPFDMVRGQKRRAEDPSGTDRPSPPSPPSAPLAAAAPSSPVTTGGLEGVRLRLRGSQQQEAAGEQPPPPATAARPAAAGEQPPPPAGGAAGPPRTADEEEEPPRPAAGRAGPSSGRPSLVKSLEKMHSGTLLALRQTRIERAVEEVDRVVTRGQPSVETPQAAGARMQMDALVEIQRVWMGMESKASGSGWTSEAQEELLAAVGDSLQTSARALGNTVRSADRRLSEMAARHAAQMKLATQRDEALRQHMAAFTEQRTQMLAAISGMADGEGGGVDVGALQSLQQQITSAEGRADESDRRLEEERSRFEEEMALLRGDVARLAEEKNQMVAGFKRKRDEDAEQLLKKVAEDDAKRRAELASRDSTLEELRKKHAAELDQRDAKVRRLEQQADDQKKAAREAAKDAASGMARFVMTNLKAAVRTNSGLKVGDVCQADSMSTITKSNLSCIKERIEADEKAVLDNTGAIELLEGSIKTQPILEERCRPMIVEYEGDLKKVTARLTRYKSAIATLEEHARILGAALDAPAFDAPAFDAPAAATAAVLAPAAPAAAPAAVSAPAAQ